ncbi:MAG: [FeFe] hydrogenase H-cluster maturation GTPase HydF [Oscillospiraceae bacterium]|nr:[FeFe] hydrogenase H-cluster maturation GTPase HydF [Oscillospiraceae bacterium]
MGLNDTVSAERIQIGFFGLRNAGKSSVVNAFTGQALSLVSPVKGTTTDPVKKAMELLPLGPVVIIDTPGIDDSGPLGELRTRRTRQVLQQVDIAVLVVDACLGCTPADRALLDLFAAQEIPSVIAYNKADLLPDFPEEGEDGIYLSALTGQNIHALKERVARLAQGTETEKRVVADLLQPGDVVLLVVPLDDAAPKGRLILPQQQVIRDALEVGAMVLAVRDSELPQALAALKTPPRLVITDSQVFGPVSKVLPETIPLTSFSILFARYKGDLAAAVQGAAQLDRLKDGDTVLISEGCTHHRQCGDIGTVKLPAWIQKYTGKALHFDFTSGGTFPEELSPYALVIHCGGCMLTPREMGRRTRQAAQAQIPMTNYGVAIAQMHGILRRSLGPFPELCGLLEHR